VRQTCKRCRDWFDGVFGRNSRMRINDIVDGSSKTFAVGERCHSLSTPTWAGVPKHSMIVDQLKSGKVAAGPAYVLGTTFLHGNEEELEVRSRETVAEIFGSQHPGVMNFVLCDGSVTTIALEIDDMVYQQWSSRRGEYGAGGVIHASPLPETPATPAADDAPAAPAESVPSAG
jgi:prepilin-type processing-associated H-X9-DG protein